MSLDIIAELMREFSIDGDIYAPYRGIQPDEGYPDTHIDSTCIKTVSDTIQPTFWLEIGSMVGGSAIRTGRFFKGSGSTCRLVCIDPFCGSSDMWLWEKLHKEIGRWRYLNLKGGFPTIKERFMSNICSAGLDDIVLPIQATSLVGVDVLKRLHDLKKISKRPQVIYLDSAHIEKETFLELEASWDLVESGGVLFGDDWNWDAVKNDVIKFSNTLSVNENTKQSFLSRLPECLVEGNVVLAGIHWFLFK